MCDLFWMQFFYKNWPQFEHLNSWSLRLRISCLGSQLIRCFDRTMVWSTKRLGINHWLMVSAWFYPSDWYVPLIFDEYQWSELLVSQVLPTFAKLLFWHLCLKSHILYLCFPRLEEKETGIAGDPEISANITGFVVKLPSCRSKVQVHGLCHQTGSSLSGGTVGDVTFWDHGIPKHFSGPMCGMTSIFGFSRFTWCFTRWFSTITAIISFGKRRNAWSAASDGKMRKRFGRRRPRNHRMGCFGRWTRTW